MPIASYEQYCKMLESAYKNKYAYPAVNIASIEAANAALAGFAEAKSDGIIQVSIGGGEHASGQMIKDSALGAISLANHVISLQKGIMCISHCILITVDRRNLNPSYIRW